MKKIISVFVFLFVCTISLNAQEKNTDAIKVKAKNELAQLAKVVQLDNETAINIGNLLESKHKLLAENLSEDRKAIVAKEISLKLKGILTPEQLQAVEAKPELMKKLCN